MYELTDEAEAALAYAMMRRNDFPLNFSDDDRPVAPFIELRDANYANVITDDGHHLVVLTKITAEGISHYQRVLGFRRTFAPLEESADELIGAIVANRNLKKSGRMKNLFDEDDERVEDFQALSRANLINVQWADDKAYWYDVTDDGLSYVKGWFEEKESPVNINIENNNQGAVANSNAESNALAIALNEISITAVMRAIDISSLDEEEKQDARNALYELEEASKTKDGNKFLNALERVTNIVKNITGIGSTVIPFITKPAAGFIQ